jgi:hypothetical protein
VYRLHLARPGLLVADVEQHIVAELAGFAAEAPQLFVEEIDVPVRIGKDELALHRIWRVVLSGPIIRPPGIDQRVDRGHLRVAPDDTARDDPTRRGLAVGIVFANGLFEIVFGEFLRCLAHPPLVLAPDVGQLAGSKSLDQFGEQATAFDTGQLPVVTDENELRAGPFGPVEQSATRRRFVLRRARELPRAQHRRLVDRDHGNAIPDRASTLFEKR